MKVCIEQYFLWESKEDSLCGHNAQISRVPKPSACHFGMQRRGVVSFVFEYYEFWARICSMDVADLLF